MRNCQFYCSAQNKKCPKHHKAHHHMQQDFMQQQQPFQMNKDLSFNQMLDMKQHLLEQQHQLNLMINRSPGVAPGAPPPPVQIPGGGFFNQQQQQQQLQPQNGTNSMYLSSTQNKMLEQYKEKKLQQELQETKSKLRLLLELEKVQQQTVLQPNSPRMPNGTLLQHQLQQQQIQQQQQQQLQQIQPSHNIQLIQKQLRQQGPLLNSQPGFPVRPKMPACIPNVPASLQLRMQQQHQQRFGQQQQQQVPPAGPMFNSPLMMQQMRHKQQEELRQRHMMMVCQKKAALAARSRMVPPPPSPQSSPLGRPPMGAPPTLTSLPSPITPTSTQDTRMPVKRKSPTISSAAAPLLPVAILPRRQHSPGYTAPGSRGQQTDSTTVSVSISSTAEDKKKPEVLKIPDGTPPLPVPVDGEAKESSPGKHFKVPSTKEQYEQLLNAIALLIMSKISEYRKAKNPPAPRTIQLECLEEAIKRGEFDCLTEEVVDANCTQTVAVQTRVWTDEMDSKTIPQPAKTSPVAPAGGGKINGRQKVGTPRKHPYTWEAVKTEPVTVKVKLEPENNINNSVNNNNNNNNNNSAPIKEEQTEDIKMETTEEIPTAETPAGDCKADVKQSMGLIGNIEQMFMLLQKDSDDDTENIDVNSFLANL